MPSPNEEIQKEEDGENEDWQADGGIDEVALPTFAVEELINTSRHISANETKDGVEEDHNST